MIAATDATRHAGGDRGGNQRAAWFQLYLYPTREVAASLVRRAEAAGYRAIVLTVDMPIARQRERDRRQPSDHAALTADLANFAGMESGDTPGVPHLGRRGLAAQSDAIALVLKGILAPEDALKALEYGVNRRSSSPNTEAASSTVA